MWARWVGFSQSLSIEARVMILQLRVHKTCSVYEADIREQRSFTPTVSIRMTGSRRAARSSGGSRRARSLIWYVAPSEREEPQSWRAMQATD